MRTILLTESIAEEEDQTLFPAIMALYQALASLKVASRSFWLAEKSRKICIFPFAFTRYRLQVFFPRRLRL